MSTHIVNIGSFQGMPMQPNMPRAGVIGGFALSPGDFTYASVPTSGDLFENVSGLAVNVGAGIAVAGNPSGNVWLCVYQPAGYPLPATAPFTAGNFSAAPPSAPASAQCWTP